MKQRKQILVVGSGIAGLIAALRLHQAYDVTIVTKSDLAESNTRWAQGGIAAAMFPDDSVVEHIADSLRAGAGLCNRAAVDVLCSEGPARIHDLIRLGVEFDRRDGVLARRLEAAHSHARVLHAKGDATGLSIEMALVHAVQSANIHVLEHVFARDLLMKDGRVVGLEILHQEGQRSQLEADAVILASGGAGHLYLHTTNPAGATGDGIAMALRAGAQIADAEFYQFHPTALAMPDTFLISEAVRGEGAVLLDEQGRRFMQMLHPDAELAPRDVVARGIAMQMAVQRDRPVLLDATHLEADFLRTRFPNIHAACLGRGLNWTTEPIPVTPAAHYWMGGVQTDLWGRTSIAGLLAVGEVACTGVHGANRLASNSLLESLVFAWRCADLLLQNGSLLWHEDDWPASQKIADSLTFGPEASDSVLLTDRKRIQTLMWEAVGIERNGNDLRAALNELRMWRVDGESVQSLETANLLQLARLTATAALTRLESRGSHYREDFPESSSAWQHSLVYAQKVAIPC